MISGAFGWKEKVMEILRKRTLVSACSLAIALASPALALDLGLGDDSLGVDASVSVGDSADADASVSVGESTDADASVSIGGSSGADADDGAGTGGGTATDGTSGTTGTTGTAGTPGVANATGTTSTAGASAVMSQVNLAALAGKMVMSADSRAIGYVEAAEIYDSARIMLRVRLASGLKPNVTHAHIVLRELPKKDRAITVRMTLNRFLRKL